MSRKNAALTPRVPWRMRWRLHRAARTDRRAGLPVGLSADTTPVLAELVALYGHACERERTTYLAAEAELSVRLRRLDAQIDAGRAEVRRRSDEVQRLSHPTSEDWLASRFPGEELLPAVATRTRRAVAHQRQLAQAQADLHSAAQELENVRGDRAEVEATLRSLGTSGPARGHVFNLGHGISQHTPPEAVAALVDAVHELSKTRS